MILLYCVLAILAQVSLVGGQLLLKRAVVPQPSHPHRGRHFALAIACMTLYFFIWMGVLRHVPLSQLAPFDALGPILLVAWAHLARHERLSLRAWLGVATILAGVTLITLS